MALTGQEISCPASLKTEILWAYERKKTSRPTHFFFREELHENLKKIGQQPTNLKKKDVGGLGWCFAAHFCQFLFILK